MTVADRELLEQARGYDIDALAAIYDRHASSIYRYVVRLVGDADQAEDLTSEVFLKLLEVLGTKRAPRENLQGWLYRVAHNLAMDWFRAQGRLQPTPPVESLAADQDPLPVAVVRRQMAHQLRIALARLTSAQQRVILLRFGEGLPVAEVARLTGRSEGAIKILQHRAVTRLRTLMKR